MIKLAAMGTDVGVLSWIEPCMSNRKEQMSVSGQRSEPYIVTSGILQGSVLGALFFLAYVNDIANLYLTPK